MLCAEAAGHLADEAACLAGHGGGEVAVFVWVGGEVVELGGGLVGVLGIVAIYEFPAVAAVGGEVVAAMFAVGEVHEEIGAVAAVGLCLHHAAEACAVKGVVARQRHIGYVEHGWVDVHDGRQLGLHSALLDGHGLLRGGGCVRLRPADDAGHSHTAFVGGAFLAAVGGAGAVVLAATERGVATIVAHKDDDGVAVDGQLLQLLQNDTERMVHSLYECGVGLGLGGGTAAAVTADVLRVGLEGVVHRVVGEGEEEGPAVSDGALYLTAGLGCECVCEEGVGAVVVLQAGHGAGALSLQEAVAVLAVVAAGLTDGRAGDIDIVACVDGVFGLAADGAEVAFADMDGAVSGGLQQRGEEGKPAIHALPVPLGRAVGRAVVALGVYPVGGAVARGVLPREEAGPGGGAHALGIERGKPDTRGGEALHVGGVVPLVEGLAHRVALAVGVERQRGVHQPHVIDKKEHDVRPCLRHCGNGQCSSDYP